MRLARSALPSDAASGRRGGLSLFRHPGRVVVVAFLVAAAVGTALLSLPIATETRQMAPLDVTFFTSVSAVTVTGLAVVDTSAHWSTFGELVILSLIQLGGFGITTLAALVAMVVFRRLGLRSRLTTQVEQRESAIGNVRGLVGRVAIFYLIAESVGALLLWVAAMATTDATTGEAGWFAVFHSISAFNNAGFSTRADNLMGFAANPLVLAIVGALVVLGGIGYPVVADVVRWRGSWRRWSLHTRMTLSATAGLLVFGAAAVGVLEWSNPATLGELPVLDRIVNAGFGSITPRTAGFNTFDYGAAEEATLLVTQALMLIGGGSGSSAGGIKVTTFALLGFVIWSEMRGERDVNVFGRRVDERTQRQAVSIALVGVGLAMGASVALASMTDFSASDVSFEAVSALNTVGLSTGITTALSTSERAIVSGLMLLGRLGPLTVGTAFVLRHREILYRYPEGRPLLG